MTHFRGQIRGPHWGPAMDRALIDFWRKHECLFNSSVDSYFDKDLKTQLWSELASTIGKSASEVERRSRSLRTQYGRLLWHPENVNTCQQRMLKEKLDFLKPYIVRRRVGTFLEEKYNDEDEDDGEEEGGETEGSLDQETESAFGSPADAGVSGADLNLELSVASIANTAAHWCPPSAPRAADVLALGLNNRNGPEGLSKPKDRPPESSKRDVLNQFLDVMLEDMRQIRDPMLLIRLRRDITDLVFKAVEEDGQKRQCQPPSAASPLGRVPLYGCGHLCNSACSRRDVPLGQRYTEVNGRHSLTGTRQQRWEDRQGLRRSKRQSTGKAREEMERMVRSNHPAARIQTYEVKAETEQLEME